MPKYKNKNNNFIDHWDKTAQEDSKLKLGEKGYRKQDRFFKVLFNVSKIYLQGLIKEIKYFLPF